MNTMSNTQPHKTVTALDPVRPPDTTLVKSYNINTNGTWEHVQLDELTPEPELPSEAHPSARVLSLEDRNENHDFVIVQRGYNPNDTTARFLKTDMDWDGIGFMRIFAPEYEVENHSLQWESVDAFTTWQAAETHIANTIDQPDRDGEIIQPVAADAFIYDVQSYLTAVKTDNQPEIEMHSHRFHRYTPIEDEFYAYR